MNDYIKKQNVRGRKNEVVFKRSKRYELNEVLKNNKDISKDYEVAVIVYAFDSENKIVFQRRGLGCRDEQLKLETIGGRVKKSDIDFRAALQRKIEEEVETEANIELQEFIIVTYAKKFDVRNDKEQY